MEFRRHPERIIGHLIITPFIYAMIVPLAFLDVCLEIYHHLCFPIYGYPLVKRREYIAIDRVKLSYLTPLEKLNCAYCGYANGLAYYAMTIAGLTEKYWCGIHHQKRAGFHETPHQKGFLSYGNKRAFDEFTRDKSK